MTNINCSSDCIYQKDGKCNLENVAVATVFGDDKCVYYTSSPVKNNNIKKN